MEQQDSKELAVCKPGNLVLNASAFQQVLAYSEFLSKSDMIPKQFVGKPANVFIAVQFALRAGLDEFMVMQNFYVVHGRPGIEAKLTISLINGSGLYDQELDWDIERDQAGNITKCTAWTMKGNRKVEGPPVTAQMVAAEKWDMDKPIWKDGKQSGMQISKWKTMPEMMFRYRAATFFGRMKCPQVLMGMQTVEEIEDVVELVQQPGEPTGTFFAPPTEEVQKEIPDKVDIFQTMVDGGGYDKEWMAKYVDFIATYYKKDPDWVKATATESPDKFFGAYEVWLGKQPDPGKREKGKQGKKKDEAPPVTDFTNSCLVHGNFEGDTCPVCEKEMKPSGAPGSTTSGDPVSEPSQGGENGPQADIVDLCMQLNLTERVAVLMFTEDKHRETVESMTDAERGNLLAHLKAEVAKKGVPAE